MRIAILIPHIFAIQEFYNKAIFAPLYLALDLAKELQKKGHQITIYSPGKITSSIANRTIDLKFFLDEVQKEAKNIWNIWNARMSLKKLFSIIKS